MSHERDNIPDDIFDVCYDGGAHCGCWYDGNPCCGCGAHDPNDIDSDYWWDEEDFDAEC